MDTLLLFAVPYVALVALAFYRWHRASVDSQSPLSQSPPPQPFDGLFAEQIEAESGALAKAEAEIRREDERAALLARAYLDDETALDLSYETGDRELYDETLEALVTQADGDADRLRAIAEYIVDSGQLRSTPEFARAMIERYQKRLDPRSLADMLHLAALSDDAGVYERAIEIAREQFRQRRIPLTPRDFLAAVESGYWLISAETRYSGAGFTLKQLIAQVRRELSNTVRLSA